MFSVSFQGYVRSDRDRDNEIRIGQVAVNSEERGGPDSSVLNWDGEAVSLVKDAETEDYKVDSVSSGPVRTPLVHLSAGDLRANL